MRFVLEFCSRLKPSPRSCSLPETELIMARYQELAREWFLDRRNSGRISGNARSWIILISCLVWGFFDFLASSFPTCWVGLLQLFLHRASPRLHSSSALNPFSWMSFFCSSIYLRATQVLRKNQRIPDENSPSISAWCACFFQGGEKTNCHRLGH